jgi:hypothetical protein
MSFPYRYDGSGNLDHRRSTRAYCGSPTFCRWPDRQCRQVTRQPSRKDLIVLPAGAMYSQIAQEVQYILLLGCTQHIECADHLVGFRAAACMRLDGC